MIGSEPALGGGLVRRAGGDLPAHWAQSLLGFTSDGAVVNWLPLFAFVVLFGLSMDYTVLVLERAPRPGGPGAARGGGAEAMAATAGAR